MEILKKIMKNVRKNRVIILSLLIVILFLGGFFTGKVIFEEKKVLIPKEILGEMNRIYENEKEETVMCVIGKSVLKGWEVTEIIKPRIIETSDNRVEYESCGTLIRKDVMGMWHNHKNGLCELSDSDIFAFGQDYSKYGLKISMVQCDDNRMGIFTKDIINQQGYTFEQDSLSIEVI